MSKNTIIVKNSPRPSGERSSLDVTRKKTNMVATLRVYRLHGVERYNCVDKTNVVGAH